MTRTRVHDHCYTVPYSPSPRYEAANMTSEPRLSACAPICENLFNLLVFVLGFLVFLPDGPGLRIGMLFGRAMLRWPWTLGLIGSSGASLMTAVPGNRLPRPAP